MIAMLPVALTLLFALTTQVSAQDPGQFNVSLGTPAQTFLYNQLLDFPFNAPFNQCSTNCSSTKDLLAKTNGDPLQLCSNDTVKALRDCEQCVFEGLISANKPMPDLRAGSTPVLTGYSTACSERAKLNLTKEQVALTLPANWDGPTGIFVPTIGLVFTVGTGVFLATSALVLLSNM